MRSTVEVRRRPTPQNRDKPAPPPPPPRSLLVRASFAPLALARAAVVGVAFLLSGCAVIRHGTGDEVEFPKIVTMFCLFASCSRAYSPDREPDVLYIRCIASICSVIRKEESKP